MYFHIRERGNQNLNQLFIYTIQLLAAWLNVCDFRINNRYRYRHYLSNSYLVNLAIQWINAFNEYESCFNLFCCAAIVKYGNNTSNKNLAVGEIHCVRRNARTWWNENLNLDWKSHLPGLMSSCTYRTSRKGISFTILFCLRRILKVVRKNTEIFILILYQLLIYFA